MKTHPKQFICIFIILLTVLVSVINFNILADTLTGKPIPLDKTPKWPYIVEKEPGNFKLLILTDFHILATSTKGVKFEKNCPEGSIENALKPFADSGIVKAMFCGHDHVNDYYGIKNGIRLQYVRSSGYLGYGRDKVRKGGTLVNINTKNGTFETISVFPDGTTWTPKGFITKPEVDRIY